jgi:hypothetical protein
LLVDVDFEHQLFTGLKASQLKRDQRRAVLDHDVGDREAIVRDQRERSWLETACAAGSRIEEDVANRHAAIEELVAVNGQPVELRAGFAAGESDLDSVAGRVVAAGFFEVDGAQVEVGGTELSRLELFEAAAAQRLCRRGGDCAAPDRSAEAAPSSCLP